MDMKKLTGIALATAAAGLLTSVSVSASPVTQTAPCYGVNSCKGSSQCKTANSSCKGSNNCRGKGFLLMSPKACEVSGGQSSGSLPTADTTMVKPEPMPKNPAGPEVRNSKEATDDSENDGNHSESTVPENTTPESLTPDTVKIVPEISTTPEVMKSLERPPEKTTQESTTPESTTPEATTPETTMPESTTEQRSNGAGERKENTATTPEMTGDDE